MENKIWYDKIILLTKTKNQKVDLCLVSPNDFQEIVKEWRYTYPHNPSGDYNTLIYANCKIIRSQAIQDGKPETYSKI